MQAGFSEYWRNRLWTRNHLGMCRAAGQTQLSSNGLRPWHSWGATQDTEEVVKHAGHAEFKHANSESRGRSQMTHDVLIVMAQNWFKIKDMSMTRRTSCLERNIMVHWNLLMAGRKYRCVGNRILSLISEDVICCDNNDYSVQDYNTVFPNNRILPLCCT